MRLPSLLYLFIHRSVEFSHVLSRDCGVILDKGHGENSMRSHFDFQEVVFKAGLAGPFERS